MKSQIRKTQKNKKSTLFFILQNRKGKPINGNCKQTEFHFSNNESTVEYLDSFSISL